MTELRSREFVGINQGINMRLRSIVTSVLTLFTAVILFAETVTVTKTSHTSNAGTKSVVTKRSDVPNNNTVQHQYPNGTPVSGGTKKDLTDAQAREEVDFYMTVGGGEASVAVETARLAAEKSDR